MKILNVLFTLILMLFINNVLAAEKTQIIVYKPAIPAGEAKQGYCWTESLAVVRPNTWRCMVGNEISDPCFGTDDKDTVVCAVDPVKKNPGFALHLTQPLPKLNDVAPSKQPWILELSDKSICTPYTGTLPFIDNQPVRFSCTNPCPNKQKCDKMAGIFSINTQKSVWTAKKVIYSGSGKDINVESTEDVVIKTAWQ